MSDSNSEFELISRHFMRPAANAVLGVGDDAALIDVTNGMDLAVSTDTMVSGTHFFPDVDPEHLGHKSLAVNLSDMAAMGALPYWAMLALATSAIDISDGLLADLGHICRLSGVGATVDLAHVPVSPIGARHVASDAGLTAIVAGGDDYELCFTAPANARESITDLTNVLGIPLSRIGQVKRGKGVSLMGANGKPVKIDGRGFDHFSNP